MNASKNLMDNALKLIFVPVIRNIGFKGSLPHFRRVNFDSVELITIQTDRNGGGFVIEIAKTKNAIFLTPWGKEIPQNKLTAHDLNNRVRIHPNGLLDNSSTEDWFRYDMKNQKECNEVAETAVCQLATIDHVFKNLFPIL